MKNKKAFTLVELLAVIIILSLLMLIAIPTSVNISNRTKQKMLDTKLNLATQYAKVWAEENIDCFIAKSCSELHDCGKDGSITECYISLNTLAELDYLKYDKENKIINPVNNEDIGQWDITIVYNSSTKTFITKGSDPEIK